MTMSNITIHIKFFGAFREFGEGIDLSVRAGSTVAFIKETLHSHLKEAPLVLDSVLANDDTILRDCDVLSADMCLSILPPVCGG